MFNHWSTLDVLKSIQWCILVVFVTINCKKNMLFYFRSLRIHVCGVSSAFILEICNFNPNPTRAWLMYWLVDLLSVYQCICWYDIKRCFRFFYIYYYVLFVLDIMSEWALLFTTLFCLVYIFRTSLLLNCKIFCLHLDINIKNIGCFFYSEYKYQL